MEHDLNETATALPSLIDTHCHLDDHQFTNDLDAVLANSRAVNVNQWVLIGYDPERWRSAIDLTRQHDGMYIALGVHPACAQQWSETTPGLLGNLAQSAGAVAIGEAGLDFYRDNAPLDIQEQAFVDQLQLAHELGLPLIVHMRDAEEQMLRILRAMPHLPTMVFHSFDGSAKLMDFALETGSYVGIGGLATRQKSDELRMLLARVGTNRIVLETDSPYLVPARQKDRRNQPAHVATVAEMMAPYLGMTPQELAVCSTANAMHLFGMKND